MLNGEGNEKSKKTNKQTTKQIKQKYKMKLPELHILWRK